MSFGCSGQIRYRVGIQDYASVAALQNETIIPRPADKIFVRPNEAFYYYDPSDNTSPHDGVNVIVQQPNRRWKCLGCNLVGGANNLPWVKSGSTTATPSTEITKSDNLYRLGKTTLGSNQTPLATLHVGDYNNNPSTDAKILISHNVVGSTEEHAFSDGSIINNNRSYNSFDARCIINSDLTDTNEHYAAFQSTPTLNTGKSLNIYYGHYDRLASLGTVSNYYGFLGLTPTGTITNYNGVNIVSTTTASTTNYGAVFANMAAPTAVGVSISGINGSTTSRGIQISNMAGSNRRPIFTQVESPATFAPNEFRLNSAGNNDLLMFGRGAAGVNTNDYLGMIWEAASSYYSGRFASRFDASLKGEFLFFTNPTGASGIGSLVETARIRGDGSIEHQGYHKFDSGLATTGASVPNGSLFKGTDGALYFKGGSGTVTLIAPN